MKSRNALESVLIDKLDLEQRHLVTLASERKNISPAGSGSPTTRAMICAFPSMPTTVQSQEKQRSP